MADLDHLYGADLSVSANGDLALADGTVLGEELVLRRLLTNAGDDAWNPTYGAGLPRFVGLPASVGSIGGVIRSQLALESAVAAAPPPSVAVAAGADGTVTAAVSYVDAITGATATLSLPLGGPT